MSQKNWFITLGVWFFVSIAIPFSITGIDNSAATRIAIMSYFAVSLLLFYLFGRNLQIKHPKRTFIILSLIGSTFGEISYMISRPLNMALLVTPGMSPEQIFRNTAIDLILTFPAYLCIFSVIWFFARRYQYTAFSFLFIMGLAQSLGDGLQTFLNQPSLLLFTPYIMVNYWAMTFVPFLVVRKSIDAVVDTPRKKAGFLAHILPLLAMPLTYYSVAIVIILIGRALGWLPPDMQ